MVVIVPKEPFTLDSMPDAISVIRSLAAFTSSSLARRALVS